MKKYTAEIIIRNKDNQSVQSNLPFAYLTIGGARRNAIRMSKLMLKTSKLCRGGHIEMVNIIEVKNGEKKLAGFIAY